MFPPQTKLSLWFERCFDPSESKQKHLIYVMKGDGSLIELVIMLMWAWKKKKKKSFLPNSSCCCRWSGRPRSSSVSWPSSTHTTNQSLEAWRRSPWAWWCSSSVCRWASTAATLSTLPGIWGLASSRHWQVGGVKFSRKYMATFHHPSIHSFIHSVSHFLPHLILM